MKVPLIGLALVVLINLGMLVVAYRNKPVLESDEAYEEALRYDQVIEAERASAALGWRAEVQVEGDVVYTVRDAGGQPLGGLRGNLRVRRSDTVAFDAEHPLEEVAPGRYRAPRPKAPGLYEMHARLEGGPAPWLDERRVVVR